MDVVRESMVLLEVIEEGMCGLLFAPNEWEGG